MSPPASSAVRSFFRAVRARPDARVSSADAAAVTRPSRLRSLLIARSVRGFGDGFAVIILPAYLSAIGFSPVDIGILATASLFGTSLLTLGVGFIAPRHDLRNLLIAAAVLMALSGLAFPNAEHFALVALVC